VIVRFDTPEEAKKRFEELKEKYNPGCGITSYFQNAKNLGKDDEFVAVDFRLKGNVIEVGTENARIKYLTTSMKLSDVFQEV